MNEVWQFGFSYNPGKGDSQNPTPLTHLKKQRTATLLRLQLPQ